PALSKATLRAVDQRQRMLCGTVRADYLREEQERMMALEHFVCAVLELPSPPEPTMPPDPPRWQEPEDSFGPIETEDAPQPSKPKPVKVKPKAEPKPLPTGQTVLE